LRSGRCGPGLISFSSASGVVPIGGVECRLATLGYTFQVAGLANRLFEPTLNTVHVIFVAHKTDLDHINSTLVATHGK
jgi:hypothetical protein